MSRLTSRAPFNRPSVFDVLPPRPAPLSPPETEMEPSSLLLHEETNSVSPETQQGPTETPTARFRRVSTLAYTSSALSNRESRSTQRQSKWLVIVTPPASLTRSPQVLGHTLSSGPVGRFSNGILMPLFPTLYGQLTAIAREFNMPSTTGVCVYLQLPDAGASLLTPRISDETWQLLWGHFFAGDEHTSPLPAHGLPISGRIEFDIDLRRAKWFNSWMGHRDLMRERAESDLSREPSMVPGHWRGESRTTLFFPEQTGEDSSPPADGNPPVTAQSSRTAIQRQMPRPLLLERRETSSVRSFMKPQLRAPSISPDSSSPNPPLQAAPVEPTLVPKALPSAVQEQDEPQTAEKAQLDSLVRQWRQGSVQGAADTALAAAGQPSLDPVNMPAGAHIELDMDDFAWSISSAGPASESPSSPDWPEPLPSVHLQGRLQGSVCLTPSVCTSFGPLDDWPDSPVSCVSRRPSPDLGMRVMDFVPLTPSTATSWGPDDIPSPTFSEGYYEYRAPSVDLGVRGMGSRPVTPSTATSWGPLDSPLFMPSTPHRVRTPDAGERAFPDLEIRRQEARAPVFPYYSAWNAQPWGHVWPYQAHRHRENESTENESKVPPVSGDSTRNKGLLPEWPDFAALYPADPTMERVAANKSQPVMLASPVGYPFFDLYPAVYPHTLDEIYPTLRQHQTRLREDQACTTITTLMTFSLRKDTLLPEWPDFAALYPADPRAERAAENKSQPIELPQPIGYPFLELYPAVYPYSLDDIYPALSSSPRIEAREDESSKQLASVHVAQKKELLPEWPDFASLYPSDPKAARAGAVKSQPVTLLRDTGYPSMPLYAPVYPYNLLEIYPSVQATLFVDSSQTHPTRSQPGGHSRQLHLEYPDFAGLYPSDTHIERVGVNKAQPVVLRSITYPFVSIYPSVYPFNLAEIYSPCQSTYKEAKSFESMSVRLSVYCGYPTFNLYPAPHDFPTFEIYPPVTLPAITASAVPSVKLTSAYPVIELYEPVYPYLVIYPQTQLTVEEEAPLPRPVSPRKRALTPGPSRHRLRVSSSSLSNAQEPETSRRLSRSPVKRALVPPLPVGSPLIATASSDDVSIFQETRRTSLDLHRPIVEVDSSPRLTVEPQQTFRPRRKPKRTHHDLHLLVFGTTLHEDLPDVNNVDDFVPELPSRSTSTPARSRSRSGTVSSRPVGLPIRPLSEATEPIQTTASQTNGIPNVRTATGRSRRPSVSTAVGLPESPPNTTGSPSKSFPPLSTAAPPAGRRRAPSVSGAPPHSTGSGTVLNRVLSMNIPARRDSADAHRSEPRGLDRSKSLSDPRNNRQSIVFERARMFTLSENDSEVSNVVTDLSSQSPMTRPISKLDRSKLPFA